MSVPQIPVIRAPPGASPSSSLDSSTHFSPPSVPLVTLADASHPIAPLDDLTRAAENLVEATFHIKAKIYDIAPSAMENWVQASCFKCRAMSVSLPRSCRPFADDEGRIDFLQVWYLASITPRQRCSTPGSSSWDSVARRSCQTI